MQLKVKGRVGDQFARPATTIHCSGCLQPEAHESPPKVYQFVARGQFQPFICTQISQIKKEKSAFICVNLRPIFPELEKL